MIRRSLYRTIGISLIAVGLFAVGFLAGTRRSTETSASDIELIKLGLESSSGKVKLDPENTNPPQYQVKLESANARQLRLLQSLPGLNTLEIQGISFLAEEEEVDPILAELVTTTSLHTLRLSVLMGAFPKTYAAIANAKQLRSLSFWMVKADNLPILPAGLLQLQLGAVPVNAANVEKISQCRNLESLDVTGSVFEAPSLQSWSELRKLKTLILRNPRNPDAISSDSLKFVSKLQSLETIFAESPHLDDRFVESILPHPHIAEVFLIKASITDSAVHQILQRFRLKKFAVSAPFLTDAAFQSIGDQRALTMLKLPDTQITNRTAREILTLDLLEHLNLSRTKCDSAGLEGLAKLVQLKNAELNQLTISDDILQSLSQLGKLDSITLLGSEGFTGSGLESIAGSPSVKTLRLTESEVASPAFVEKLKTKYPEKTISAFPLKDYLELQE